MIISFGPCFTNLKQWNPVVSFIPNKFLFDSFYLPLFFFEINLLFALDCININVKCFYRVQKTSLFDWNQF